MPWPSRSEAFPAGAAGDGRTCSILLVEDDPAVADLVRTLLNRVPGWGVTVVHDAAAAGEVLRHVRVEMLLLEVHLPGPSAVALLDELPRERRWHRPAVVLLSGHSDRPESAALVAPGDPVQRVTTPRDREALVSAFRRATAETAAA